MGDHEETLKTEYDDITLKTRPFLFRFGGTFRVLRFDERSFFNTLLDFAPYWDYKPTNSIRADSAVVYTGEKY